MYCASHDSTLDLTRRWRATLAGFVVSLLAGAPALTQANPFDATPDDNLGVAAIQGGFLGAHIGGVAGGLAAPHPAGVGFEMAALAADMSLKNTPPLLELPGSFSTSPNARASGSGNDFYCVYQFGERVGPADENEDDGFAGGIEGSFASIYGIPYNPLDDVFGNLGKPAVYHPQADVRVRAISPFLADNATRQVARKPEFPSGRHDISWEANTSINLIMDLSVPSLMIPLGIGAEHMIARRVASKNAQTAIGFTIDIASEAGLITADVTSAFEKKQWYEDTLYFTAANRGTQTLTVWDEALPYFRDTLTGASHINVQDIVLEATDFGGVRFGRVQQSLRDRFEPDDDCGENFEVSTPSPASRLFTVGNTPHELIWEAREEQGGPYEPAASLGANHEREGENLVTRLIQRIRVIDTQAPLLLPPAGFARETTEDLDLTSEAFPLGRPRVADLADPSPVVMNDAPAVLEAGTEGSRYYIHWWATDNQNNTTLNDTDQAPYVQVVTLKPPGTNTAPRADNAMASTIASEPVEILLTATDDDILTSDGRPDPLEFQIESYPAAGQFEAPLLPYFVDDFRLTPAGEREDSGTLTRTSPLKHLANDFRLTEQKERGIFLNDKICNAAPGSLEEAEFGGVIPIDFVYRPSYVYVDDQNFYYVRDYFFACGEGENSETLWRELEDELSSIPRISKWTDTGELVAMRALYPTADPRFDNANLDTDFWPHDRFYVDHEDRFWSTNDNDLVANNGAVRYRNYFSFDSDLGDMRLHGNIEYDIDESPYLSGMATDARYDVLYEVKNLSYRTPVSYYRTNWITVRRYGTDLDTGEPANKIGEIRPDYHLGPMNASSIAVDSEGYIYAGDRGKHRIYKFSPTIMNAAGEWELGEFIGWMGRCTANKTNDNGVPYSACDEDTETSYGFACTDAKCVGYIPDDSVLPDQSLWGDAPGQFNEPSSIAIDPRDILYVADHGNSRVQRFGADGTFAGEAKSTGSGVNQGDDPGFIIGNMGEPEIVTVNSSSFFVMEEDPDNGDYFVHSFKTTPFYDLTDASAKIAYVSNFDFLPEDAFTFSVTDGIATSAPATVSVSVTRAFTPPERLRAMCYADAAMSVDVPCELDEDSEIVIRLSAYDPDGFVSTGGLDSLSFELLDMPANGALELLDSTDNAVVYRYTPDANFNGEDALRFRAYDQVHYSADDRALSLTVLPTPDPVTIEFDDDLKAARGFASVFSAEFSDIDEDPDLQASLVSLNWGDGSVATAGNWTGSGREDLNGREVSPQVDYGRGRGALLASHNYSDAGTHVLTATMDPAPGEAVAQTVASASVDVVEVTVVGANLITPDNSINPDTPFVLNFAVENYTPSSWAGLTAGDVQVSFDVPEGLTLAVTDPNCAGTENVVCNLGDLDPGEQANVSLGGLVSLAAARANANYELVLAISDAGPKLRSDNVASLRIAIADRDGDGKIDVDDPFPNDARYTADQDGDGLPDTWERAFGYDPAVADDTASDADGDGFTLLQEFQNGSYPRLAEQESITVGDRLVSPDNDVEDRFGLVMAGGDLNQDGIDDLVIGASKYDTTGAVFIAWGLEGGVYTELKTLRPQSGETLFGRDVVVGDWDDNDIADLAIAAEDTVAIHWNNGELYETPDTTLDGTNGGSLGIETTDLDNDGVDDLLVVRRLNASNTQIDAYLSTSGGLDAAPQALVITGDTVVGFATGDVDGDGLKDLLIGQPAAATVRAYLGSDNSWLTANGLVESFTVQGPVGQLQFGWALAADGDVTGDGIHDLVVSAYGGGGTVNLYDSAGTYRSNPATPPLQTISGQPASAVAGDTHGDQLGVKLALGHLDTDNYADIAIGANRAGAADEGQVRILHGSPTGFVSEQIEAGDVPYDLLGHGIAIPGDLDGNGIADVAGGASDVFTAQNPTPDGGYVQLYYHDFGLANAGDDNDDDGVGNGLDNCPANANTAQGDFDGDGMGDACDNDIDGDGLANAADNCPRFASLDQTDTDNDLDGDLCDDDDDNDGVPDGDDAFPLDKNYSADSDGDGQPDAWETANGLDPNNAADAGQDLDSDGQSNLGEFTAGTDPTVDDYAPVLSPSANLLVNSTGPLTPVNVTAATANDAKDGDVAASSDQRTAYPPGRNIIRWRASDSAGNEAMAEQRIDVVPMVEFVRDAMDLPENGTASVHLQLNGEAVSYPVTVPITLSGTASKGSDYALATDDIEIDNSGRAAIDITAINDGPGDDGETIIVSIGSPTNGVAGPNSEFTITLRENNLAPLPGITAEQGGALVTTVTSDGGDVLLTASAGDPQAGDSHSFDWSGSDVALVPAEGYSQSTFTFAPAGLADGVYRVEVEVTDNGNPAESARQHRYVRVVATAPTLDAGTDSDGDGIDDAAEGLRDSNGNGASDYLDPASVAHHVVSRVGGDALLQTQPGYTLALGRVALASGDDALVPRQAVIDFGDAGGAAANGQDENYDYVAGIHDFEIAGLPRAGHVALVVIPQTSPVPANGRYRKYHDGFGWSDFVTDARNTVSSAEGVAGVCPAPGSNAYTPGLTAGDHCVQLMLEDGGPNDADGMANAVIRDPGGIATDAQAVAIDATGINVADKTVTAGSTDVVMLRFQLMSNSSDVVLRELNLAASGTGNDVNDVTAVRVWIDRNADGAVDAADTAVGSGSFGADNGTLSISLANPLTLDAGMTDFIVTYDY